MFRELLRHHVGYPSKTSLATPVETLFERHDQVIVKLAMDQLWPTTERRTAKSKTLANLHVKFAKDNVNGDGVGVDSVDSRRIKQIKLQPSNLYVPPSMQVIRDKPPYVTKKMRAWKRPDWMPEDAIQSIRASIAHYSRKIFNALAIKVDFSSGAPGNTLKLLNHATFCTVAAI